MHRPLKPDHGVTLIELVVAVAILALGTAAAWRSLDAARRGVGAQADRVLAQEVALNRAADLRLAGGGDTLPETERMGGIDWTVTRTARPAEGGLVETEIVVTPRGRVPGAASGTAPGGAGARLLVWLPPEVAP
jgi:general secretion pathway protein I